MILTIPKTMRAAVYRGVNQLCIETVPVPRIRSGELLVRVAVCGVCPTDITKIHYGTVLPPRIFGHETAGTVIQVGACVRGFRVGERVALHHHVPCTRCHACRHRAFAQCPQYKKTGITAGFEPAGGGFAEYVRVMSFVLPGVVRIPQRNSFLEGAMLEPVNTVLKAVRRLALLPRDQVMVMGQGPIGLMFTRLLSLRRINVVATDFIDKRLEFARGFGARHMANPREALVGELTERVTKGRGFDAVVVAVPSNEAVREALSFVRGGGQVLLFAHTKKGEPAPVDLGAVCVEEKDLIGSYSSDFMLQSEVARLVFSRKFDVRPLVSHEFPLIEAARAVQIAANPTFSSLKILIRHP